MGKPECSARGVLRYDAHLACADSLRRSGDVASMMFRCHYCKRHFEARGWASMERLVPHPRSDRSGLVYVCEQCEGARAMGFRSWLQLEDEVGVRLVKHHATAEGGAA